MTTEPDNKEAIRALIPILQAYVDGATIQRNTPFGWRTVQGPMLQLLYSEWRILPEGAPRVAGKWHREVRSNIKGAVMVLHFNGFADEPPDWPTFHNYVAEATFTPD